MSNYSLPSIDVFYDNYNKANQVADQNDRYIAVLKDPELQGGDVVEFQDAAIEGLRNEQADTMHELSELSLSPYDSLVQLDLKVEKDLLSTHDTLTNLPDIDEKVKARLLQAAARAVELSPRAKESITSILDTKIEQLPDNPSKVQLAQHIAKLEEIRDTINQIYTVAGQAWPLPIIPQSVDLRPDDGTFSTVDTIPDDTPDGDTRAGLAHRTRERYGRNAGASELTTLFLMENEGVPFDALSIAGVIYDSEASAKIKSDGKDPNRYLGARIHRLFSPGDSRIPKLLENEGLLLQYGWRTSVDRSGEQVGHRIRIYRAIKAKDDEARVPTTFIDEVQIGARGVKLESKELSVDNERMVAIEDMIRQLDSIGIISKEPTKVTANFMKLRLWEIQKKLSDNPFVASDQFKNLLNMVTNQRQNESLNEIQLVAWTIGNQFGKNLPPKQKQRVLRQIDAALANFYPNQDENEELAA